MNGLTNILIKEQPECIKNIGSPAILEEIDRYRRLRKLGSIYLTLSEEARRYQALEKEVELNEALRKAEISVFDKSSVKRYKALYQKQKSRRSDPVAGGIMLTAGIIAGILMVTEIVLNNFTLAIFFGILLCVLIPIAVGKLENPNPQTTWKRYKFKEYAGVVPSTEVVMVTEKIRKFLPYAEFFIEELVTLKFGDFVYGKFPPFFGVSYGKAEQYLEVWNEPQFKDVH
jgi:hypothetical protein